MDRYQEPIGFADVRIQYANVQKKRTNGLNGILPMVQDRISREKPLRWVAGVFERSGDLIALGGGMIGLALIAGVIIVGLHERQTSFRSTTSAHYSDTAR